MVDDGELLWQRVLDFYFLFFGHPKLRVILKQICDQAGALQETPAVVDSHSHG